MTEKQYEEHKLLEAMAHSGGSMSTRGRARLTAYRIHTDGSDRSGWDSMMNDIDDVTAEEIIDTWTSIVLETMDSQE